MYPRHNCGYLLCQIVCLSFVLSTSFDAAAWCWWCFYGRAPGNKTSFSSFFCGGLFLLITLGHWIFNSAHVCTFLASTCHTTLPLFYFLVFLGFAGGERKVPNLSFVIYPATRLLRTLAAKLLAVLVSLDFVPELLTFSSPLLFAGTNRMEAIWRGKAG
jgi:hypothetical protein